MYRWRYLHVRSLYSTRVWNRAESTRRIDVRRQSTDEFDVDRSVATKHCNSSDDDDWIDVFYTDESDCVDQSRLYSESGRNAADTDDRSSNLTVVPIPRWTVDARTTRLESDSSRSCCNIDDQFHRCSGLHNLFQRCADGARLAGRIGVGRRSVAGKHSNS